MEPNPNFIVLLNNNEDEVSVGLEPNGTCLSGYYIQPFPTIKANGFTIAPMGGAITPERPFKIQLTAKKPEAKIEVIGVIHGWSEPFREVPKAN